MTKVRKKDFMAQVWYLNKGSRRRAWDAYTVSQSRIRNQNEGGMSENGKNNKRAAECSSGTR
jgi:hypothetical protein